ncbi:hypothetical protein BC828DRAFT_343944 [Blastocladiella britannica]|nr:hypothetical protein BC828DRAFT_343944 [Blastocladiella britannica]
MPPNTGTILDTSDWVVLGTLLIGGAYWLLRIGRSSDDKKVDPRGAPRSLTPAEAEGRTLHGKYLHGGKDIVILYGSQTGTGEDFAARLAKDGAKYGLSCLPADPEDFDMEDLAKIPRDKLVVFVMATYGEGEPTDNAVGLHEYLMNAAAEMSGDGNDDEEKPLAGLHYAVFGLGNKTYEQFNAMARKIDKWCTALGGVRVGPRGEGDDDENMEEDFAQWRDELWPAVAAHFKLDLAAAAEKAAVAAASHRAFAVTEYSEADAEALPFVYSSGELGDPKAATFDAKNPFYARVVATREVFSGLEPGRNCVHMELELTGSRLYYQAGDHLALWPEIDPREVTALATAAGLAAKLDTVLSMTSTDPAARRKHPFPCPTTYRAALTHYLDIGVPPKPHVLQAWVQFADPESPAHAFYTRLATDKDAYAHEVAARYASASDLLAQHPLPALPVEVLLESFTRIQPRYYSISSSPRYVAAATFVHITASVLRYEAAEGGKQVVGLATRYLYDIHQKLQASPGAAIKVPVTIRHAAFKLPRQNATPVIMVGPGTGVAPFRGFVQERVTAARRMREAAAAAAAASAPNSPTSPAALPAMGEAVLFFGCRHEKHDFLYSDEWPEYIAGGGLTELVTAFSRDGANKVYVQHRLAERADQMWELVSKKGAHIYVCGDAKNMAKDVQAFFVGLARDKGGMPEERAVKFVKDLRSKGRYLEDVWS